MNPWDVLSGVGTVLDTPRRLLYAGGDAAARGLFGYSGKPVEHFADLLGHAGMDPDSMLTHALGFAGDVATDPLTWAGGYLGKKAGQMLFNRVGPMHGGDAGKLAGLAVPAADAENVGAQMASSALKSPHAKAILNEVPAGSQYLGSGAEALALKTPQGDVLKIAPHWPETAIGYENAADFANAPSRRQVFGNIEVSRQPLASQVNDPALFGKAQPTLAREAKTAGYDLWDMKPENVGMVGGRPKVIDLGGMDSLVEGANPFAPIAGRATPKFLLGGMGGGAGAGGAAGALARYLRLRRPDEEE